MGDAIIFCGRSCVGKTTGAAYLAKQLARPHIEASSIMRSFWQRSEIEYSLDEFAAHQLQIDPDRVPRAALRLSNGLPIVISGLRSPLEINAVRRNFTSVHLIYIEASFDVRLSRAALRARRGHANDFSGLQALDQLHDAMGLGLVSSDPTAIILHNDGQLDTYCESLAAVAAAVSQPAPHALDRSLQMNSRNAH